MEITAKAKHIRMSARKVRLVVDLVRGSQVEKALDLLKFVKKLAVGPVVKVINSGIANALNNFELEKDNLFIKEIRVDEGQTLDRWMPKAHGRATPLRKKSSHIILVLSEIKDSGKKKAKDQKLEAPLKLGEKPKTAEGVKVPKKEKEEATAETEQEHGKPKIEVKPEGRRGHGKIEGGKKGFVGKMFQRKSG